jgi:hypothetical protein
MELFLEKILFNQFRKCNVILIIFWEPLSIEMFIQIGNWKNLEIVHQLLL